MAIKNVEIKVEWRDIKRWNTVLEITHGLMIKKFTPHFTCREDDLMQEMMIVLIKAIRRIKKGEIESEQNYVITCLKYAAFRMAKKLITYDQTTVFLEDLKGTRDLDTAIEWLDLFDLGVVDHDYIFSAFETLEERYMLMIIIKKKGYSRVKLKEILCVDWNYMTKLEVRVKEKIVEIIKMYTT